MVDDSGGGTSPRVVAIVAVLSAAIVGAGHSAALADQVDDCLRAAMSDYVKANTALLTSVPLVMTVEATVAQRRLQEQYCLRSALCEVARGTSEEREMRVSLSFNKCLEEEAKEKYELVPRPDN